MKEVTTSKGKKVTLYLYNGIWMTSKEIFKRTGK